jgi:hypothetical protein
LSQIIDLHDESLCRSSFTGCGEASQYHCSFDDTLLVLIDAEYNRVACRFISRPAWVQATLFLAYMSRIVQRWDTLAA